MAKQKDISPREAATRLRVRLDSLYALIWAGKLMAHKLEGRWRVSVSAVEERLRAKEGKHATVGR
jgi:excisionase family DNA binding protein